MVASNSKNMSELRKRHEAEDKSIESTESDHVSCLFTLLAPIL